MTTFKRANRRTGVALALVLSASSTLLAHDFWIQPSSFTPPTNAPVRVHLRVGDHFSGEAVARNEDRIARFFSVAPSGETRDIVGRDGVDPAGVIRFDMPGLYVLGYHGRPSAVTLDPRAFEAYLEEEGLERIIRERADRGESATPGREQFSRSVKALLRAGSVADSDRYDRAVGLPLEIVPEADPFAPGTSELPVRLLFGNQPLAGAVLVVMWKASISAPKGEVVSTARSDQAGRAVLKIAPGFVLIKAVHMVRAAPDANAEWTSTWTSLTFETYGAGR